MRIASRTFVTPIPVTCPVINGSCQDVGTKDIAARL